MSLKNKRILITAGPTWVPIDKVRVISNTASGKTGILLAEKLARLGAKITLLLGPVEACCLSKKIKLVHFRFFDELKNKALKELKEKNYDIVIHSAAVSDYCLKKTYRQKVKSDKKDWSLSLVPTPKIINLIKRSAPGVFLVGFKFEPGARKEMLIAKTKKLFSGSHVDLAVANTIEKNKYCAYLIEKGRVYGPLKNKDALAGKLIKLLEKVKF